MPELVSTLDCAIMRRTPVHVWGISIPLFALVRRFPEIVDFSQQFDIITTDGAGVLFFSKLLSQPLRAHVSLPAVSHAMIELAASKGHRVLVFGATPEINAMAGELLLKQYPSLKLLPGIDGYYPGDAESQIAGRIRDLKPDILLVGMSLPKKELFCLRWKEFMRVPVIIACGGYIDVLAGKTRLAPKFLERLALSWFWRFVQEPKRLFSNILVSVFLFLFYVLPAALINRVVAPDRPLCIRNLFPVKHS